MHQITELLTRHKIAAASVAGGVFFFFSLLCCGGTTWFVASDVGAAREKKRAADEHEKILNEWKANQEKLVMEWKASAAKAFGKSVFDNENPVKIKAKEFAHTEAVDVNGVRVELTGASIGKLPIRSIFGNGKSETKDSFFQIRYRVTNKKENFSLKFVPWRFYKLQLVDEFGNRFSSFGNDLGSSQLDIPPAKQRLDPGDSETDLMAFDRPLPTSKSLKLELDCGGIGSPGERVIFNIPRSFFEKK